MCQGDQHIGITTTAYKAVDGTVSKGVEFELNGAITDRNRDRMCKCNTVTRDDIPFAIWSG
ncbi:hypothetical protein O5190_27135, partial [Escherichia coli]|nr:hypothetical protein [Escherichia coli]